MCVTVFVSIIIIVIIILNNIFCCARTLIELYFSFFKVFGFILCKSI